MKTQQQIDRHYHRTLKLLQDQYQEGMQEFISAAQIKMAQHMKDYKHTLKVTEPFLSEHALDEKVTHFQNILQTTFIEGKEEYQKAKEKGIDALHKQAMEEFLHT